MKKIMWAGFGIAAIMLLITYLLLLLQKPIPDLVFDLFGCGLFTCVIFSLFTSKNTKRKISVYKDEN